MVTVKLFIMSMCSWCVKKVLNKLSKINQGSHQATVSESWLLFSGKNLIRFFYYSYLSLCNVYLLLLQSCLRGQIRRPLATSTLTRKVEMTKIFSRLRSRYHNEIPFCLLVGLHPPPGDMPGSVDAPSVSPSNVRDLSVLKT